MHQIFVLSSLLALACGFLLVDGNPLPQEEGEGDKEGEKVEGVEEAIPHAYTLPNATYNYSTIQQILEEIAANKHKQDPDTPHHVISKRYMCYDTNL